MFEKLGIQITKRSKAILLLSIVLTLVLGGIGTQVFARFDSGGYSDPNSDSAKVFDYLKNTFDVKDPALVVVVQNKSGTVDDVAATNSALNLESKLKSEASVEKVISYWSAGKPPSFRSKDNSAAYIFVYLKSDNFTTVNNLGGYFQKKYEGEFEGLRVRTAGGAIFSHSINSRIQNDLKLSETISIPLTFILLTIVFGALVASAMPLVIGITAIMGTFFILYIISLLTNVSIFALNLTTGLGLGLGIDYALLIVNRFREELSLGKAKDVALVNTMKSAGKTVFYSGLTVVLTLVSLTFFPIGFLKSMGYAGSAVVFMAVIGALIPLPAVLMLLGNKVDKFVIRKSGIKPKSDGAWSKIARFVMRKPVPIIMLSGLVLTVLVLPITNAKFSQVDSRVLPKSDPAYQASAFISENFPGQEANPIEIIFPNGAENLDSIKTYSTALANIKGIVRVGEPQISANAVRLIAIHALPPRTPESQDLINKVRKIKTDQQVLVGGFAADYTDSQNAISGNLPLIVLWIMIAVLLLLFSFTGSILLPIKAVLLNFLSLAATVGLLTAIFIDGKFNFLVGDFINTKTLDTSSLVLVAVVAFGLSMDYEVFLLSRIKEEYDLGKSNEDAVAEGLQKSARIITAAAFILAIVFAAFILSGVTSIKMMGFGIAFAILLDATLIRAFLVPALMRLFGKWNWWAPKPLKRFTISH